MNAGSIGQSIINGTYGSESKPLTAYEELKAWCEKHLGKIEYNAQNDNGEGLPYIDLYCENQEVTIWFFADGSYSDFDNHAD